MDIYISPVLQIYIISSILPAVLVSILLSNRLLPTSSRFTNFILYTALYVFIDAFPIIIFDEHKSILNEYIDEYLLIYPLAILAIIRLLFIIFKPKKRYFSS